MKSTKYRTLIIVLAFVALAGWAWKPPVRPGAKATVDRHGQPKAQPGTQLRLAETSNAGLLSRSAAVPGDSATSRTPQATQARLAEAYGKLPLSFEANQGQTDRRVKFLSRGSGYTLFLSGNEAVLALRKKSGVRSREPWVV